MNDDMITYLRKVSGTDQDDQVWIDMGRRFALLYRSVYETLADEGAADKAYIATVMALLQSWKAS